MTISSTNSFFTNMYSNISKKNSTDTINESFKVHKEYDVELTAFTKKVEGDYSTYSAKELSELSYNEIKAHYEEIKEVLEARMEQAQDIMNSDSFKNYQKRLIADQDFEIRGTQDKEKSFELPLRFQFDKATREEFGFEGEITDEMLDEEFGEVTRVNKEVQDLLNFNDKFKIVNYFDNDQINRAIYSKYEDNSQVFYDYTSPSDLDGSNGFFGGSAYTIQGNELGQILASIDDALEYKEQYGSIPTNNDTKFDNGFNISGEKITIAGKTFSIYDVKKSVDNDYSKKEDTKIQEETEVSSETSEVENEKPDYSTYSAAQLRQLSFDEAKENFEELEKILENSLKNVNNLNKDEVDNLLAFKAQLEKVNYLENDTLNEALYDKLQNIEDPKVAVWSDLAITENIKKLQDGDIDSMIINDLLIYASDLKINEEDKENNQEKDTNLSVHQIESEPLNLDSIIEIVSKAAENANKTSQDTYKQEVIKAYSDFISEYNKIKSSLLA